MMERESRERGRDQERGEDETNFLSFSCARERVRASKER